MQFSIYEIKCILKALLSLFFNVLVLYVGIKDNGEICGVQDIKKLMEDIPNKVRDMLGILIEVNLKEKDGKQYLEIATEAYPYPISFRGKYY